MKQILLSVFAALLCTISLLSCQTSTDRKQEVESAEQSDGFSDSYDEESTDDQPVTVYTLTANSLGSIKIGMEASSIPNAMPGLYHGFSKDSSDITDETIYTLSTLPEAGGENIMVFEEDENGTIDGILLPSDIHVNVSLDNHLFYLPEITAGDLFKTTGCMAYHLYWMGLCIYTGDITFFFELKDLSPQGSEKVNADLYEEMELTAGDFMPEARPRDVLIGTKNFN